VPPPSMMIFDAPTRDFCVAVRQKTSTPLQSLALMNDPQYLLAAEHLSNKIFNDSQINNNEKIIKLYRTVTGRKPNNIELDKLNKFLNEVVTVNKKNAKEAFVSLAVLIYNLDETTQKS